MSDALGNMVETQRRLQARIAPKIYAFGEAGGCDPLVFFLKENAYAMANESMEVVNALPWKMHKADFGRGLTAEEREHLAEEAIDVLHFVLNILLALGVDAPDEIERRFIGKNRTNHQRWDGERI